MIVRFPPRILGFFAVACALPNASLVIQAADSSQTPDTEADLVKLKNSSADVRLEALRDLQTSLDLRIPDAMLPLLSDEGNSIRRLAARAIGSRWWQIAKERMPEFVTALHRNDKTEFEDEETECLRDRQESREIDVETLSCRISAGVPRHGTNNDANKPSMATDSDPPLALDKFIEQSGLSVVTVWRYRRAGWLKTLNIRGRHYLTRSEIARFNARAAAGEFAKAPTKPKRCRGCKAFA